MCTSGNKSLAYDFAAENDAGITIFYNYINGDKELEVNGCDKGTRLAIPEIVTVHGKDFKVTSIADECFKDNKDLQHVAIPNCVTSIGNYAFSGCYNLMSVNIPKNVKTIGNYAFDGCNELCFLYCNVENPPMIDNQVFGEYSYSATRLYVPESSLNSYKTTSPWDKFKYVFGSQKSYDFALENADGVTIYYKYNNDGKELSVVKDSESIILLNDPLSSDDFYPPVNYSYTGNLVIPEEVTYMNKTMKVTVIGDNVFNYTKGVTSVSIPASVKLIGMRCFDQCFGLSDLYCYADNPPSTYFDEDTFEPGFTQNGTLHVPAAAIDKYKSAEQWKDFKNIVAIEEKDPDVPTPTIDSPIVGKWKLTNSIFSNPAHTHVEYKEDGTFSYTREGDVENDKEGYLENYEQHGLYKIEGNTLYQLLSNRNEWYSTMIWLLDPISLVLQNYCDDGTLSIAIHTYQKVNPEPPSNEVDPILLGKWERISDASYSFTHVEYKPDGTFSLTSTNYLDYEEHGKFRVEDNLIYELFSNEDEWMISRIKSLNSSNMILEVLNNDALTTNKELLFRKIESYNGITSPIAHETIKDVYCINGERRKQPSKGINIIKMSDGTVKKVMVK